MKYVLRNMRGDVLSEHPNLEGAQLSALFHVKNGQTISWWPGLHCLWGKVDGKRDQFEITEKHT